MVNGSQAKDPILVLLRGIFEVCFLIPASVLLLLLLQSRRATEVLSGSTLLLIPFPLDWLSPTIREGP